jgi:hypothetical protein
LGDGMRVGLRDDLRVGFLVVFTPL